MDWYYANGQEQVGPVDDAGLDALARSGAVTPETLVWHAGMGDWRPYREVAAASGPASPLPGGAMGEGIAICAECGRPFPLEDMVQYSGAWVCAVCKPAFFQRLKEGGVIPGQLAYAGFWIRLGAHVIDYLILSVLNGVIGFVFGEGFFSNPTPASPLWFLSISVMSLVGLLIGASYETWFVGRFGGTPGKLACGLRVVRPDGSAVTYGRAFGRFWGKLVSGVILYIGFIMIGFDEEKRGLHDRMCDTRVVRK